MTGRAFFKRKETMPNYITQSDIEASYGVENIAQWSNLDNDDAQANVARITTAITYAEAYIDDKLRDGRYEIPITGTIPSMVVDMAAKMAGVWLFNTRRPHRSGDNDTGEIIQGHQDEVDSLLAEYASGQRKLTAAHEHSDATAPTVVM